MKKFFSCCSDHFGRAFICIAIKSINKSRIRGFKEGTETKVKVEG